MANRTAILRTFLIVSLFEATCQGCEKSLPVAKSAENFLFKYFDLPVELKSLPTDVQHLISAQLTEQYVIPFVLQEPIAEYTADSSKFELCVDALEFSPDDSHLAMITNDHCRIGPLTLDGTALNHSLSVFESQLPLDRWVKIRLNANFTKMIVVRYGFDKEAILSELELSNYKVIEKERVIGPLKKLLQDDTLYGLRSEIIVDGVGYNKAKNLVACSTIHVSRVAAICYTPSEDLVIATTYKQIFLLGKDGSVKKIEDTLHKFNPAEIALHEHKGQLVRHTMSESRAILNPSCPQVTFQSVRELTLANFETGEYKNLLENNPGGPLLEAASSNGQWVVLLSRSIIHVIDTKTAAKRIFPPPYKVAGVEFIFDGKFLLIHQCGGQTTWIYDTQSLSLIGCIDHRYNLEPYLADEYIRANYFVSTSSTTGKYFALCIDQPQSQKDPLCALRIWQSDPNWHKLQDLYRGHLTLEQVLFIIFLRKIYCEKSSLTAEAQKAGITRELLVTYLQDIRDSFKVDQKALRSYLRYVVMREPKPKDH